jgi:hypothetical protein
MSGFRRNQIERVSDFWPTGQFRVKKPDGSLYEIIEMTSGSVEMAIREDDLRGKCRLPWLGN